MPYLAPVNYLETAPRGAPDSAALSPSSRRKTKSSAFGMRAVRKTAAAIPKKARAKKIRKVKYNRAREKAPYRQSR